MPGGGRGEGRSWLHIGGKARGLSEEVTEGWAVFSHRKAVRSSSLGGGKSEYGHWEPWWDWQVLGKGSQCDSGSRARGCAGGAARSGRVSSAGLAGWGEEWGFPFPSAGPPGTDVTHWAWDPLNQLPGALDFRPHQQVTMVQRGPGKRHMREKPHLGRPVLSSVGARRLEGAGRAPTACLSWLGSAR